MWTIIMLIICSVIAASYRAMTKKREEETTQPEPVQNSMSPIQNEPTVSEMAEIPFREKLLKELGAEIMLSTEEKDRYMVGYQGGTFEFCFGKQNHFIQINFPGFYSCSKKDLDAAYVVANTTNLNHGHWTCSLSQDDKDVENPISASLGYLFPTLGTVSQCVEVLRILLPICFDNAREFKAEMERIMSKEEFVEEHHQDGAFNQQMRLIQLRRAAGHSSQELEEEYPLKENQTLAGVMKLFQDVDKGCLNRMNLWVNDHIEEVTDPTQILSFDIREYIKNHPQRDQLNTLTIVIEFDKINVFINLKRASAECDKTVFYKYSVMRSDSLMENEMEKAYSSTSVFRGLLEVRLTTENQDYWEAKYTIDDALDKWNNGQVKDMTDEQRMIVACVEPSTRLDLYWGKKYYNRGCLLQALPYFKRVVNQIKHKQSTPDSPYRDLYNEINFYIGFIYMDLKMYDTAYYYLHIAQREGSFAAIEEFMNCLCNVRDWDALVYIRNIYEKSAMALNEEGEDANPGLLHIYRFAKRRMAYALINNKELDEAESMLKAMVDNGEDVEFAKGELEYIQRERVINK